MESTGVYWIPVYQILEGHGIEVVLLRRTPVESTVAAPSGGNGEGWEDMAVWPPYIIEHSPGNDVPLAITPGFDQIRPAIGGGDDALPVVRIIHDELWVVL